MEAFNVKGTYHKEKHCAEIKTEHAVKAEYVRQGFQPCDCNEVMLRKRSRFSGWTDTGNKCKKCHGQIVEEGLNEIVIEKDEEEVKGETVFPCEIQNYPTQIEDELTAQQVLSRLQNLMTDSVTAKKHIHELEENNACLEKKHAEEKEAHAATKKKLEENTAAAAKAWDRRQEAHAATQKELKEEKEAHAGTKKELEKDTKEAVAFVVEWAKAHAEEKEAHAATKKKLEEVETALQWKEGCQKDWLAELAGEQEKNASLEKKLAQSNKANEDLCAGLYSAKEKNDETNKMLSDLIKVSDKQEKPQITETCDDTLAYDESDIGRRVRLDGWMDGREATITNFYLDGVLVQHELTYDDGRKQDVNMKQYKVKLLPDKKKRKAETCDDTKTATFDYKVDGVNGTYVGGFVIMPEELGRPGVGKFPHGPGVWTFHLLGRSGTRHHIDSCREFLNDNELLKYDGNWKNGKMHGEGTETRWKLGCMAAKGRRYRANSAAWEQAKKGEWCDGVKK